MNTQTIINTMGCLAGSLTLIGCATNQTAKLADADRQFRAQEYVVALDNGSPNPNHVLSLRVADVRINGEELKVSPQSIRAQAIRDSLGTFGAAIAQEMSHASVSRSATQPIQITVSFDGKENSHAASAFGKGFVTGFLTLGIVGYIAPGEYTYQSKVSVDVSGQKGTYSAESQDVTVKYDLNDRRASPKAVMTAIRQADDESLQKIGGQMAQQGFFR
jgi:hypothetical protein